MYKSIFKILNLKNPYEVLQKLESIDHFDIYEVNEFGQSPLHISVLENNISLSAILLSKGLNPNKKDINNISPFFYTITKNSKELFLLLLNYQKDLKIFNNFGGTPLHPSSEKGYLSLVQLSIDHGVPLNHENGLGWSALQEAVIFGIDGYLYRDIVEELVLAKANVEKLDFYGLSAIDYARINNRNLILKRLEGYVKKTPFSKIKSLIREDKLYKSIQLLLKMPVSEEQIYYLGLSYEKLEKYDIAAYYYEKGSKMSVQFFYYLVNLSKKINSEQQVFKYFDKGLEDSENNQFFLYHKSNFLRELGKHDEAIFIMDELLRNNPNRVDYIFHKSNSLISLGRINEAFDLLSIAQKIQPNNDFFARQILLLEKKLNNDIKSSS